MPDQIPYQPSADQPQIVLLPDVIIAPADAEFRPLFPLPIDDAPADDAPDDDDCECENCGRMVSADSGEISEARQARHSRSSTVSVCDRCAFTCRDCGDRFADSVGEYHNADGNRICDRCADSYSSCDECDCVVHQDNTHYNERTERTLCNSCHREERSNRDGTIHDHSFKPRAMFHQTAAQGGCTKYPAARAYYGIEVETEAPNSADQTEDASATSSSGLFYCKEDGSITDGFEIVSHPATLEFWREIGLQQIKALKSDGYRSYKTTTCGMHIHVSRKALSSLDQFKLLLFFRKNRKFITRVSRREVRKLNEWASIDTGNTVDFYRKVRGGGRSHGDRYTAINFNNASTIEFRIFRGTLDVDGLKRNIEFTNAIIQYVKRAGITELHKARFMKWLAADGKCIIGKVASKSLLSWFNTFPAGDIEQPE